MRTPPNLLILHTDQQSTWTLGAYGGTLVETPHIDRLAREGSCFQQFFTNSAVCTPSRGCLLTGRYPHQHGAYTNQEILNRDEITLAHVLAEVGYETGYAGKWHLDGTPRPGWVHPARSMGFQQARCMYNRGHWKKIVEPHFEMEPMVYPYHEIGDEETYTTDWLTEKTLDFVRQPRRRPFFFMASIPDPHTPFTVRPPYDNMYDPAAMPLPETLDNVGTSQWETRAQGRSPYGPQNPDRETRLKQDMAQYCGQVKLIDDSVGRILAALEDMGLLEETLVVFTTDHGEYMGEHGLLGKNNLYETAYRIPLLMRWPAGIPSGLSVERLFSTVDFQPTVLGLMGIEPSGREVGRNGADLVRGEDLAWTDEVHIHHSSLERAGIFTPQYELAYVKDDQAILFDRIVDPQQVTNRFSDPDYQDVVDSLTARILAHHREVGSPALDWLEVLAQ
jgi:arylsulfatase A-like enzyme